jgi:hypothetical protein
MTHFQMDTSIPVEDGAGGEEANMIARPKAFKTVVLTFFLSIA